MQATVGTLKEKARSTFGIEQTQPITLWDNFDRTGAKVLSQESHTLTDAALQTGQQVCLTNRSFLFYLPIFIQTSHSARCRWLWRKLPASPQQEELYQAQGRAAAMVVGGVSQDLASGDLPLEPKRAL